MSAKLSLFFARVIKFSPSNKRISNSFIVDVNCPIFLPYSFFLSSILNKPHSILKVFERLGSTMVLSSSIGSSFLSGLAVFGGLRAFGCLRSFSNLRSSGGLGEFDGYSNSSYPVSVTAFNWLNNSE